MRDFTGLSIYSLILQPLARTPILGGSVRSRFQHPNTNSGKNLFSFLAPCSFGILRTLLCSFLEKTISSFIMACFSILIVLNLGIPADVFSKQNRSFSPYFQSTNKDCFSSVFSKSITIPYSNISSALLNTVR